MNSDAVKRTVSKPMVVGLVKLKSDHMKVEHKEHELLITIPKA
jgi:hypothetical protein